MGERNKSALLLSGLANKEAFLECVSQGNQVFPIMSTVKVTRDVKSSQGFGGASQLADDKSVKQLVSLVVVHAKDQPWSEPPGKAALEMIPMIRDLRDDTSCIIPAGLHMVQTTPHYAFTIACSSTSDGGQVLIPCQKSLALVRSTKNSKPTPRRQWI